MFAAISEKMVVAVDWDARRLRLVHAGLRKGRARIDRLLAVDIPDGVDVSDPESMGALVRKVLDQQKIRTSRVVLDVPRDQALLTTLKLPAAAAEEMPAMVEYQIAKELPFPLSEAVVDFAVPDADESGTANVLVGTVRRDVIAYYERTCEKAGLRLERLGFRPYANRAAVNELYGAGRYGYVLFVDVGPRLTEIDVITSGKLAFSRAASMAVPLSLDEAPSTGEEYGDAEEEGRSVLHFPGSAGSAIDRIVQGLVVEVTRSFEAYRANDAAASVDLIVVAGSVGIEAKLAEVLGHRFGAAAEMYDPARQFGWPAERGSDARGFAAALGLACGHAAEDVLHFDFLHPKKAVTTAERRLRKVPRVAAVLVLFVAAAIVYYFTAVAPNRRALALTEKEIAATKKAIEQLQDMQKMIEQVDNFEEGQVIWLDELNRLHTVMPPSQQMVLGNVDMSQRESRIMMKVDATERQIALNTVQRIDELPVPGHKGPYFDATAGSLVEKSRDDVYKIDGSMNVVVLDKVTK